MNVATVKFPCGLPHLSHRADSTHNITQHWPKQCRIGPSKSNGYITGMLIKKADEDKHYKFNKEIFVKENHTPWYCIQ